MAVSAPALALIALMFPLAALLPLDAEGIALTRSLLPPGRGHLLGTDELGRDLLSRALLGGRISLVVAALSTVFALVVGTVLGVVAGYVGGVLDEGLMRAMDVVLSLPAVLVAAVILSLYGPSLGPLALAIGVVFVPSFARIVRASTLATRSQDYVAASILCGTRTPAIIARTVLPNAAAAVIVQTAITASTAVLLEASLSFLGLGTQPPTPSWGLMLAAGKGYLSDAPWYPVVPGVMIAATVFVFDSVARGASRRLTVGSSAHSVERS